MTNADREVEKEKRRQGGPARTPGMITTTGGKAGPAMRPSPGRNRGKTAPTTTGDAGSGGMDTPTSGTTSANNSGG